MKPGWQRICSAGTLVEAGNAVRFQIMVAGDVRPAFAIRFEGRVYAYVNACAHRAVELDWVPGQIFDAERRYLICATHGARYEPATGHCVGGPCAGAGLVSVPVREDAGAIYLDAGNDLELLQEHASSTTGIRS